MARTIPAEELNKRFIEVKVPFEGNLSKLAKGKGADAEALSGSVFSFYVRKDNATKFLFGDSSEIPEAYIQIRDEVESDAKNVRLISGKTQEGLEILVQVADKLSSGKDGVLVSYKDLLRLQNEKATARRVYLTFQRFMRSMPNPEENLPDNQQFLDFYYKICTDGFGQLGEKPVKLIEDYLISRGIPLEKGDVNWDFLNSLERKQKSCGVVINIRRTLNKFAANSPAHPGKDPITNDLMKSYYLSLLDNADEDFRTNRVARGPESYAPFGAGSLKLLEKYLASQGLITKEEIKKRKNRQIEETEVDWEFLYKMEKKQNSNGLVAKIRRAVTSLSSEKPSQEGGSATDSALLRNLYRSIAPFVRTNHNGDKIIESEAHAPFGYGTLELIEKYLVARKLIDKKELPGPRGRARLEGEADVDKLYELEKKQKSNGLVAKIRRAAIKLCDDRSPGTPEPVTDNMLSRLYQTLLPRIVIMPSSNTISVHPDWGITFGYKSFQLLENYLVSQRLLKKSEKFKAPERKEGEVDWMLFYNLEKEQRSNTLVAKVRMAADKYAEATSGKRNTDELMRGLYDSLLLRIDRESPDLQFAMPNRSGYRLFGPRAFLLLENYLISHNLLKKGERYHPTKQDNPRKVLESKEFLDTLQDESIDLGNLGTVKSKKAKKIFKQKLGINVESPSAQTNLDTLISSRRTNNPDPQYRKIVTEWDDGDIAYLAQIAQANNSSERNILDYMRSNRGAIEEDLGRTLFACQMKMANLGLISPFIRYGPDQGRNPEIIYPFPQIHSEEEPAIVNQFGNYKRLLEARLEPEVIPALAFESVATFNGKPQFLHATLPIGFNGADLNNYTGFEQEILTTVQHYLADPGSFVPEKNYLKEKGQNDAANILALQQGNGVRYAQVFLRTAFSIDPQRADTNAIRLANGSEIYLFKHNGQNITFESTRK
jgi:hypothetical protein